jgi:hypothetical protein
MQEMETKNRGQGFNNGREKKIMRKLLSKDIETASPPMRSRLKRRKIGNKTKDRLRKLWKSANKHITPLR